MKGRYESRGDLDRIAPGQFQESSSGNRVFFIDRETGENQKSNSNVFIAANEKGKSSVTTARSGRIEMKDGAQVLLLDNGQRLESVIGKSALKVSEFEQYGSGTGNTAPLATDFVEAKLLSTRSLIKAPTPGNLGELAWRLGLALAAINFVILAVALASVNPRGGRSGNIIFVLLTFLVYNNLLNLGQSWIFLGRIGFGNLLLLLHGSVLCLALMWLAKRNNNWTLRSALRRPTLQQRPSAGSPA